MQYFQQQQINKLKKFKITDPPQPPSSQADGSLNKQEYATTSPMAVGVQPVAATPRMMTIQVPANVYPGQLLRVRSPEGTFFDVS